MLNNISLIEYKAGIYKIQKITRNDYYHQNTYIIINQSDKNQIIIDPGDNAEYIEKLILKNNVNLNAILFTHGHFDHIGGSNYLSQKFDVNCYVNDLDLKLVKQSPNYALLFEKKKRKSPEKLKSFADYRNSYPKILHTPGHSAGSSCFLIDDIIFTGDTILLKETGRTDLPGGSEEKLKESLSLIFSKCNDSTIIFPGHGEVFYFKEFEKINNNECNY